MATPYPGQPNTRRMIMRQEVADASSRHVAAAEKISTELINQGFDRRGVNAILQHLRAFVDVHFDKNTHEGRKRNG